MILYTIEFAKRIKKKDDLICISTNDLKVIEIVEKHIDDLNLIIRPDYLSSDSTGMTEVLLHALKTFEKKTFLFNKILLLQPTSPFRYLSDYDSLCMEYKEGVDIVVSVTESKANPYFNLFEVNKDGFLEKSKIGCYETRQECPKVFLYNGSMYLMRVNSLKAFGLHGMINIRKSEMPVEQSIDIDTAIDWVNAELFLNFF